MKTYLFTYCLSLLFATALTPLVIAWAQKRNLIDEPNARTVHIRTIARVGGIAIFLAFMLSIFPILLVQNNVGAQLRGFGIEIIALLAGSAAIFVVGLCDDLYHIRVRTKLIAQVTITLGICCMGIHIRQIVIGDLMTIELGWWGYALTLLWIIGITNAVNLIDGLDGLAAGISAIVCGVIAIVSIWQGNIVLAVVMLALVGSLTGFLFFNFHPAKIFMGDGGSLFLGFTIATSSVMTASHSETLIGLGLPMLALGIPIFDTLFAILRRFLQRRGIMSPDKSHFHHLLLARGLKQHHVAIAAYVLTLFVSALGLLMLVMNSTVGLLVLLLGIFILVMVFRGIGSVKIRATLKGIQQRSRLANTIRQERERFEELQLNFGNAETFNKWWQCLQMTGQSLDFAQITVKCESRSHETRVLSWQSDPGKNDGMTDSNEILHLRIPVKDRRKNASTEIDIAIQTRGSLESAGRRIALFTRLAEEYGLDCLSAKAIETNPGPLLEKLNAEKTSLYPQVRVGFNYKTKPRLGT